MKFLCLKLINQPGYQKMVRVAACQITPAPDIEVRKSQIYSVLATASSGHSDFVCLPEGCLTGYYAHEDLARKSALEVDSAAFDKWIELIKKGSPHSTVIVGFNERAGDNIFDSAAIIRNGSLLGVQRKHFLYHPYFTSGTTFSTFQSQEVVFGVVICRDANYFEPSRLLALQGATILFSPMCNRVSLDHHFAKRPLYYSHFVARSFENHCWLVTADWVWANDGTSICPGHTVIYNPDGHEVARSQEGMEQLLFFDIPSEMLFLEKGLRIKGSALLSQEIIKLTND